MTLHVVAVDSGQEVIATVSDYVKASGINRGAIVSVVGAVSSCTLSNMPADDASSDIVTTLEQPLELSGTGEVNDGTPHIHCVVSGEGNVTTAGHLHAAWVDNWFVRVYISPIS